MCDSKRFAVDEPRIKEDAEEFAGGLDVAGFFTFTVLAGGGENAPKVVNYLIDKVNAERRAVVGKKR